MLSGTVRSLARRARCCTSVGPGEHFGEMALIRSVPRSATVTAVGAAELIAIRRADFFEILRKEHELAVKLLWQFLGVLADRLDQTSSDLSIARQELAAEDITDAIFPDEPRRRRSTHARARRARRGRRPWRRCPSERDDRAAGSDAPLKRRGRGRDAHRLGRCELTPSCPGR